MLPCFQAFNRAFKELGLECTCWSAHVYNDLLSQGDGTGEGLVTAYFSTVRKLSALRCTGDFHASTGGSRQAWLQSRSDLLTSVQHECRQLLRAFKRSTFDTLQNCCVGSTLSGL